MAVITISKEFGTDSEKVASLVAKRLDYAYIGKNLAAEVAQKLNLSESEVEMFKRPSQSRILRFVDRYTCSLVKKVVDHEKGCLDDDSYYETTKKLVENLYDEDNVVIIGWGGQCILQGKPSTLHVRLIRDEALKIEAVMQRQSLNAKAARELIQREENDSKMYVRHYFKADWNDARLYDLIIDMGKTTVAEAVDLICENVKHKTQA